MRRLAVLLVLLLTTTAARAEDAISFGSIGWRRRNTAATTRRSPPASTPGIGLDVTIRQGGPQVNQMQLHDGRAARFQPCVGGRAIKFVQQNMPFVAVAAMFQKDPSVLIAHPGQGNDSFAALKGKPILISADTRASWWRFLAGKFGYTDAQIRPYTFNLQPFLADKTLMQQGYLGSEPFAIEQAARVQAGGAADRRCRLCGLWQHRHHQHEAGRPRSPISCSASSMPPSRAGTPISTTTPHRRTRLIKKDNPEMPDALLAYGRDVMKAHGIVDSGDALKLGIGAMTDARWAEFYRSMSDVGLYPKGLDVTKAYTLRFVDKRVGMEMKK